MPNESWKLHLDIAAAPRTPISSCAITAFAAGYTATGAIHEWKFLITDRIVEYEAKGSLTISGTLISVEAALRA